MGTIVERRRKDGSVAYMAQISIMRDRQVAHRESKTFDRRPAATAWIGRREKELAKPGALSQVKPDRRDPTLAHAIDRYIAESERDPGRTKRQVLATIKTYDLADKPCSTITSVDIIGFAREKLAEGVQAQTVGNYLSHLSSIFSLARPAWGYQLDPQAMKDALTVAKKMGLTRKAKQRDRRPTLEELDQLMRHFRERSQRRPWSVPMQTIIGFAIFSTRRQEEIVRITWADLDIEGKRLLVRDMKNPGQKIGNDIWCDLPDRALKIIQ